MDKPNYFLMNPFQRFFCKAKKAIVNFPSAFVRFFANIGKGIANFFVRLGKGIGNYCAGFVKGNALTKGSYAVMGLGHMGRGQAGKGLWDREGATSSPIRPC